MASDDDRPRRPEEVWDHFIDTLDLAGQRGGAASIRVPPIGITALVGRRFGELTRQEAQQLARVGDACGRRGDTLFALWVTTQEQLRGPARLPNGRRRPRRRT